MPAHSPLETNGAFANLLAVQFAVSAHFNTQNLKTDDCGRQILPEPSLIAGFKTASSGRGRRATASGLTRGG